MPPQSLPALQSGKPTAWEEAVYAFLVEKRARSGSTRTVESYARMLWPFFRVTTPDRVRPAERADPGWRLVGPCDVNPEVPHVTRRTHGSTLPLSLVGNSTRPRPMPGCSRLSRGSS